MEKTVTVNNKDGIDADVVSLLVQTACRFDSAIHLKEGGRKVNMKSIMGMMSMVVPHGHAVEVLAEGDDAAAAIEQIESVLAG